MSQPSRRDMLRLAGAAGLAPLLAACAGAPPAQKADPGKFTVYWNAGHDYEAYRNVIKEFEKAHNVTVNMQKFQWPDMRTKLLADFSSGTVPDLVEEPGIWSQEFGKTGDALSLDEFIGEDGQSMGFPDDWQPVTVTGNQTGGKQYGIQLHFTCTMLFYNKTMLSDAGVEPPTTWEEFLDAARRVTRDSKDGVHGVALNQDQNYASPWLLQAGVKSYDPETGKVFTPMDAAIEAMQFQGDLVHKHKVSAKPVAGTDPSGPQKLFSAGRAAMILTGPWDLTPIRKAAPDLEFGVAPPPTGKKQATIAAGTSVFVPAKAARPELSWDLIKRLTDLKVEKAATKEAGMLMPRKSWADAPETQGDEVTKAFSEGLGFAAEFLEEVGATGKLGPFDELLKSMYQDVVIKGTPASKAVPDFAAKAEKALKG